MVPTDRPLAVRLGFWSAILAAAAALTFLLGIPVSTLLFPGSPAWTGIADFAASYQPWAIALTVVPSLLIAPPFLALVVSLDTIAPTDRRPLTRLGLSFAAIYVATVGANYFLQLGVVRLNLSAGTTDGLSLLASANPRGIFWALEILGYFWQGVALLLTALAFPGDGLKRWIRWASASAFLGGVLSLGLGMVGWDSFTDPRFIISSIPWAIGFPAATILLAVYFRRAGRSTT